METLLWAQIRVRFWWSSASGRGRRIPRSKYARKLPAVASTISGSV